jgi:hypothetical protein
MKDQTLQLLFDRVKGGDAVAEQQLDRALQPVVSHAVRRIIQTEAYGTPLGQRVRGLLAEDGMAAFSNPSADLGAAALAVARKICRQTMARLKSPGWEGRHAAETVWA